MTQPERQSSTMAVVRRWLHRLRVVTGDNTASTECRGQHLPTGQYTEMSDLQTMRIHRSANYHTVLINNPKVLSAP